MIFRFEFSLETVCLVGVLAYVLTRKGKLGSGVLSERSQGIAPQSVFVPSVWFPVDQPKTTTTFTPLPELKV